MDLSPIMFAIENWGGLIAFLAGLIGGEESLLTLAFLSANGLFPFLYIFIYTSLGVWFSDILVFSLGKTHFFRRFKDIERFSHTYKKIDSFIIKLSRNNIFLTLLYTKFIYGTRVLTLLYLGSKEKKYSNFLIPDLLVVFIWSSIFICIGYLGGSSFYIIKLIGNIQIAIVALISFIFIVYIIRRWIKLKLLKMQGQFR